MLHNKRYLPVFNIIPKRAIDSRRKKICYDKSTDNYRTNVFLGFHDSVVSNFSLFTDVTIYKYFTLNIANSIVSTKILFILSDIHYHHKLLTIDLSMQGFYIFYSQHL